MNYLWADWLVLKIALVGKAIRNWGNRPMLGPLFRSGSSGIRAQPQTLDADTDDDAVRSIAAVIDRALKAAEAERAELTRRLDDALSQAAVVSAFDVDDVLTGSEDRAKILMEPDAETRHAQERLRLIQQNISHFKFLKAALQTRFPDTKI